MHQVRAVIAAKLRMARHQVLSVRHDSKLKIGVISVSALLLWVGAFLLFYAGFNWLISFGSQGGAEFSFGDVLMQRMLSILSLAIFLLLIFSNVLVSFSTLYRSHEVIYLLQGPMTYRDFFYARFFECVAFSSWALAYLGSPLMLAYGMSTEASPLFYAATIFFYLPFIIIPACLGCLITLVLVWIYPYLKTRSMVLLGGLTVGLFIYYIRGALIRSQINDENFLSLFIDATARTQSPFFPSYWASQGILEAAWGHYGSALYWLLMLISTALMGLLVDGWVAQHLFYPGWSALRGQDKQRFIPYGKGVLGKIERVLRVLPQPYQSLIMKDIRLFWRDPTQWSQFIIFFGVMGIYIANIRQNQYIYEKDMWRSFIACINVGALTLVLATLTSRFVFPLISLEGKRFWILGLAPLTFKQLIWQKFWLSVFTASFFTLGLAALSGRMLQLPPLYYFLTLYSVLITNFGLSGLAVGLGSLYPTFTEDNPARIVSGMGGTLNLVLSVAYITLIISTQTLLMQWRVLERFTDPGFFWYAFAAVMAFNTLLSLACTLIPIRLGLRNLNQMEF